MGFIEGFHSNGRESWAHKHEKLKIWQNSNLRYILKRFYQLWASILEFLLEFISHFYLQSEM